jgi:hypothetical protein
LVAVDIDLGGEREGDVVFQGAELDNLLFGAGFLCTELVARETDNNETAGGMLLVEGLMKIFICIVGLQCQ